MVEDKADAQDKRKIEEAGKWLRQDFMKFARDERFAEAFAVALPLYWDGYYTIENAEEMSMNEALRFFDWFVFDYQFDGSERLIDIYHRENFDELSQHQQIIIDKWLNAPAAAAYELSGYDGQDLFLKDFVTGESFTVYQPAGHGRIEPGDLLLGRLVPVMDKIEFSSVVAFIPQDEIEDLAERMEEARSADLEQYPEATYNEFMRRQGHLVIHHALEQSENKGRPPVAAEDPSQAGRITRKAAKQLRKLPRLRR
jgi:hypothetical protein